MTSATKPVVLLDLDRMLYDTDRFMTDLKQVLHRRFHLDIAEYQAEYSRYYTYNGEMRHYDFFRHMQDHGLDPDEVERVIEAELGEQDYAYADVAGFVDFITPLAERLLVLTHGEHRFQYLKYTFAPALRHIGFKDVLTHKREYIAERFAGQQGVLIDDHQVGQLPDGFAHIWLSRYAAPGAYHSLPELQAAWSVQGSDQ